jgi:serine/threonine-protein kinase
MTGSLVGEYQLETLLGRGAMGEVYLAHDTRRNRYVALKLLSAHLAGDQDYRERFRRESYVAARLQEPHVIPIHDSGEIDGRLFIDMRLVKGSDLGKILTQTGPMPPRRAVEIISQIAEALDAAHADDLVHRDVKPANVLVTEGRDFVYLVDFGIAHAGQHAQLTATGTTIGTLDYMAPERFDGKAIDRRVDIYALACVLHESLTATRPFSGDTFPALMRAHLYDPPPKPSRLRAGIPPALDAVVARGMAKNPHDRYYTAGELANAARTAITAPSPETVLAPTIAPTDRPPPPTPPPIYPPPIYPPPTPPPTYVRPTYVRPTHPTPTYPPPKQRGRTVGLTLVLAALGVAALLGIFAVLALRPDSTAGGPAPSPPVTTTAPSPPTLPVDPAAAYAELNRQVTADSAEVQSKIVEKWVPQLASARKGLVVNGVVFDYIDILKEHQALRRQYPQARLVRSGDWSVFNGSDFFVTVLANPFETADGANSWCDRQGIDSDHCFAKLLSQFRSPGGTTKHRR